MVCREGVCLLCVMNESALEKSGNHHKTKHVQHAIIFSDATRHTHGQQNRIDTQSGQARARPFLTLARLTSLPTPIDSSHHPDCFTASNLRAPPGTRTPSALARSSTRLHESRVLRLRSIPPQSRLLLAPRDPPSHNLPQSPFASRQLRAVRLPMAGGRRRCLLSVAILLSRKPRVSNITALRLRQLAGTHRCTQHCTSDRVRLGGAKRR